MSDRRGSRPGFIDRVLARVAPVWAVERKMAKARSRAFSQARGHYDAAQKSRRTQHWRVSGTDANAEVGSSSAVMRAIARDLSRNNAYASRAVAAITNNVVGVGIVPQIKSGKKTHQKRLDKLVKDHLLTTDIDADGRHNIYGLQALMMRTIVESGEVLVRRRVRRLSDGYALPFQLQVLEADFIDTRIEGKLSNGNFAIQGIEFDKGGKRVAYHLYTQHPGSALHLFSQTHRIPSSEIAHIYRMDRPGQMRGISWMHPVIMRLRDFADYADAQLVRQKISACFAAFITGAPESDGLDETDQGHPVEAFEPGMIEYLESGSEVNFASPPKVDGFDQYLNATLHEVATGLGVPYTVLTGDLRGVNYSSGRMGWLEFNRNVDCWRAHMLVPSGLKPIEGWFKEAVFQKTGVKGDYSFQWIAPTREMIDPRVETAAAKDSIRAGLSSRSHEVRRRGHDPEDLEEEIKQDNERADASGLMFDSDPRILTEQGHQQPNTQTDPDDQKSGDDDPPLKEKDKGNDKP